MSCPLCCASSACHDVFLASGAYMPHLIQAVHVQLHALVKECMGSKSSLQMPQLASSHNTSQNPVQEWEVEGQTSLRQLQERQKAVSNLTATVASLTLAHKENGQVCLLPGHPVQCHPSAGSAGLQAFSGSSACTVQLAIMQWMGY